MPMIDSGGVRRPGAGGPCPARGEESSTSSIQAASPALFADLADDPEALFDRNATDWSYDLAGVGDGTLGHWINSGSVARCAFQALAHATGWYRIREDCRDPIATLRFRVTEEMHRDALAAMAAVLVRHLPYMPCQLPGAPDETDPE